MLQTLQQGLYLDAVESNGGCPSIMRSDCGSENVVIAGMKYFLRGDCKDEFSGEKAHQYGSSPSNQRIDGWWSAFRRSWSNWWINFFQDMSQSGILELGNIFDMNCLAFCFSKVIEEELVNVKDHWNSHDIRKSRHDTIAGVPEILFFLPEKFGSMD